jgi:nitrate/nitrite transporter NarK
VVYGWIGAAHQLGASLAAVGAGTIRTQFGDYRSAFWISGAVCFATAFVFLTIGRRALKPALDLAEPVPAG